VDSILNGATAPGSAQTASSQHATKATLTRCRDAQALIVLDGCPFNGYEVRPNELRRLGEQLIAIAEMAARLPAGGKHWRPTTVWIEQAPAAAASEQVTDAGGQS
jgi:hypothetical protein